MKGALITLGVLASVLVIVASMCIGSYNTAIRHETGIKAQYEDMENILGNYSNKVQEASGVSVLAIEGLKEVMTAALQGRYGENGSQATMQWIKENYPGQVDPGLYAKVQQIIESGRNEFQNSQTMLVDKKQAYQNDLGVFPGGFVMKMFGFPRIDFDKYKIITSGYAKDAFKTGVSEPVKLK